MKKILLILLSLNICLFSENIYTADEVSLGRGVVKKTDEPVSGIVQHYDESGRLQSETSFHDGKRDGKYTWYWYDKNGQRYVREIINYTDGNITYDPKASTIKPPAGEYAEENTLYIDSGRIVDKKTKRPITGIFKLYVSDGTLERECTYTDGKRDGICKSYYENGTLHYEEVWKDGVLDGTMKSYNPDGSLYVTVPYVNGKRDGVYKSYHNNGKIHKTVTFEHGMEKGTGMVYHENGNLEAVITYQEDGTLLVRHYDKNGTFRQESLLPHSSRIP